MTYYGQWETDKVIASYFDDGYIGQCVEVGASHGTVSSNTLHFEQKGWKCLCIEPNPDLYRQLQANRPNTLSLACTSPANVVEFVEGMSFNVITLVNGDVTAISGLQLDDKLVDQHKTVIKSQHQIKVPIATLDECLDTFLKVLEPPLDFVSIDTEGTELDVLMGFDLISWKPKLLVIENNHDLPMIEKYLSYRGYVKDQRYQINDFYINEGAI